jgi:hypothetical protein
MSSGLGVTIARGLIGGLGVILIIAGIALVALEGPAGDLFGALFLFVPGIVLVAAAILERLRYRSLAAEATGAGHGPGGGEHASPEGRFRPTDERFLDPTTSIRMRVYVDSATGERRYVPEDAPEG